MANEVAIDELCATWLRDHAKYVPEWDDIDRGTLATTFGDRRHTLSVSYPDGTKGAVTIEDLNDENRSQVEVSVSNAMLTLAIMRKECQAHAQEHQHA